MSDTAAPATLEPARSVAFLGVIAGGRAPCTASRTGEDPRRGGDLLDRAGASATLGHGAAAGMLLLPRVSLCDLIADRLRDRILAREWEAGQPLDAQALARGYGVSRTPVREALKQLQQEGLVQGQTGRGVVVASVPPDELNEAIRLRRLLLDHAASRGGGTPSPLLARMLAFVDQRLCLGGAASPARSPG